MPAGDLVRSGVESWRGIPIFRLKHRCDFALSEVGVKSQKSSRKTAALNDLTPPLVSADLPMRQ